MTSREAMLLAIEEAKKGQGFVAPNPLVGCVILDKNRKLLALGYHAKLGQAHAEVHALSQIKDQHLLHGAHVIVTLEPCAHEGRTPSCAKKLATLPLGSVTYGLIDPDQRVAGQGIEILKGAGIKVEQDLSFEQELEELAEVFLLNKRESRSFVALKVATSLDGQMAVAEGESQWITSEGSRKKAHELRFLYDAVLIGSGTFLKDNPSLNIRNLNKSKDNKVVLLDPRGDSRTTLAVSNLLSVRRPEDVIVCTKKEYINEFEKLKVQTLMIADDIFDLKKLTQQLYQKEIFSIFVEGGAFTIGQFLQQKIVDRFYCFQAPKILGKQNWSWSQGFSALRLDQGIELNSIQVTQIDKDVFYSARLKSKNT